MSARRNPDGEPIESFAEEQARLHSRDHKPGDSHDYELKCKVCGVPGLIRVSIDPEREPAATPEDKP